MDITKFVVSLRAQSFGDNSVYRTQLSRRLLKCRKRLGIATRRRGKYAKRDDVTAEEIAENRDYVHLFLLTSERAWADGMSMRAAHAGDAKGITGRTRSHIISRIHRAAKMAEALVSALSDTETSGATTADVLEAFAYAGLMRGAANFEKQCWEPCLKNYAVSHAIYGALTTSSSSNGDTFKDLLSEIIDPSIQYAAYQLKTPRTAPIQVIARKAFPHNNSFLVKEINNLDPSILRQGGPDASKGLAEGAPTSLKWRGREVRIEDGQIALAWGATQTAKEKLAEKLSDPSSSSLIPKEAAAAYEDVLTASQDAVDATNQAIGELRAENVPQTDRRMQSLQITRTAVNYETISWRIGRNRVLMGRDDGAHEEYTEVRKKRAKEDEAPKEKEAKPGQKVAKLKERVALYDGTMQSLDAAMSLPGVPADEELSARLKATAQYFTVLKCLAIARSHALAGSNAKALALLHHGHTQLSSALPLLAQAPQPPSPSPLNIVVSAASATTLTNMVAPLVTHYRALVHIDNLRRAEGAEKSEVPLVERMGVFPVGGVVDLQNIVEYPPKPTFVPVKPMLLDLAWNHIDYPRPAGVEKKEEAAQEAKPQKRGWFGFGR